MISTRLSTGGLIDRGRVLNFSFDGRNYQGFQGDTLASALMANGVRVMGRSFKYHRPRGVWGAWVDDPNAIMSVRLNGREMPNCLATTTYLEDGMQARAVNAWPSAQNDIKGGLDLFHRWLGAGFYYKTFMWPNWHLFEPMIRRMAGLGSVTSDVDDSFVADQLYDNCDTLVVGGGASGLSAARAAAEAGQNVVLIDDQRDLGGSLFRQAAVEAIPPRDWIAEQATAIKAAGGRVLSETTAFGVFDHRMVGMISNRGFGTAPRLIRMRVKRLILASGALDRPMTFAGNDRPGVMSLIAAQEYLARYGVQSGRNAVAISNNSCADASIDVLTKAGMQIQTVAVDAGSFSVQGGKQISGLRAGTTTFPADTVLVSGGLTPVVHLWRHAGGNLDWCETRQAFVPSNGPDWMTVVGRANGTFGSEQAIVEARAAGAGHREKTKTINYSITPFWPKPGAKGRQWIDFQHDVTLKDVEQAARENYVSVEHLKRYTTLGMASDQGKTSNMAGLAAMAAIQGRPIPEVGITTFRPPLVPIPIETYHGEHRGRNWHPVKRLPLENAHRAADAALCEYGGWLRPGWYGSGNPDTHIQQEAKQARETAGIFDGSPLGKIEVMGPDAEAFVNFIYYNTIKTLKPGFIRYGFMLTEGGVVLDDGVISRLGPDHFLISCSSSHVDGVRTHLEAWRQDGNDPDRIFIHDMTQAYATVTVTGPKARDVLATLGLGIDLSADAFPHMTFQDGRFGDTPLRVSRVSFTGDVSYEMTITASAVTSLWNATIAAGESLGATLLGIEALSILRAEKGYIMAGKDTDGETMPHDLGFGIPRLRKKTSFVGDRSLHSDKANSETRKVLVGLKAVSGSAALPTGAHVVTGGEKKRSLGYVTSSYDSPTLGHPVALGLVEGGGTLQGKSVDIWHDGQIMQAEVCSPCAYDPKGKRLNA